LDNFVEDTHYQCEIRDEITGELWNRTGELINKSKTPAVEKTVSIHSQFPLEIYNP